MRITMRSLTPVFILAALQAVSPAQEERAPLLPLAQVAPSGLPDAALKLLPKGTVVVVVLSSVDEVEGVAKKLIASAQPGMEETISLEPALGPIVQMGVSLDRKRPILLALALPPAPEAQPTPTFIVPVADVAATRAALDEHGAGEAVVWGDGYLGMGMAGPYETGAAPAFLGVLPRGQAKVAADLAAIVDFYKPLIEQGLDELAGLGEMLGGAGEMAEIATTMIGDVVQFVRTFAAEAGMLGLGIGSDGARADCDVVVQPRPGKTLSLASAFGLSDLKALLPAIRSDDCLALAGSLDLARFWAWYERIFAIALAALEGEDAQTMKAFLERIRPMMHGIGPGMAAGMSLGRGGLRMTAAYDCADPAAYVTAMRSMLEAPFMAEMGMKLVAIEEIQVAERAATRLRVAIDAEKFSGMSVAGIGEAQLAEIREMQSRILQAMFGGETLDFTMIGLDKRLTMTMAPDSGALAGAIAALAEGKASLPAAFSQLLARAGSRPGFVLDVDLRATVSQILEVMKASGEQAPTLDPKGPPARIGFYLGREGASLRLGFGADVKGIAALLRSLD
jgi:hypothetical protein